MAAAREETSSMKKRCFESSCTTQFKSTIFRYTWTINDYIYHYKIDRSFIRSPQFSDLTTNGFKWQLDIIPNLSKHLGLALYLISNPTTFKEVCAHCHFAILNAKSERIYECVKVDTFCVSRKYKHFQFINNTYLFNNSFIFLPNHSLTIFCEIYILGKMQHISKKHKIPQELGLTLFEDSQFSDVTVFADGRELHAHRAILAARSSVFRAMFEHPLKERENNLVEILDLDYDVVEEMLRFVYTNKTPNLNKLASGLFVAADKYDLEALRSICEEEMMRNLSIANAANYYLLADRHNANDLKMRVESFIINNSTMIIQTVGFKLAFEVNPQLFRNLHILLEIHSDN